MIKIDNVMDTIREIECPVDMWENKVIDAYKEYANDDAYEVSIDRLEKYDSFGAKAYCVHCNDPEHEDVVVLVSEGSEGYVANIEDVFVK